MSCAFHGRNLIIDMSNLSTNVVLTNSSYVKFVIEDKTTNFVDQ